MIIVAHRINTIVDLEKTPSGMGVETDVRSNGKDIILHHDAFARGEKLEDFISHYNHTFIILDIKSEGVEERTIDIVERAGIKDYYLLNVNFPFMIRLIKSGVSNISIRFSEFESVDTCMLMKGKVDFVWVESFRSFTLTKDVHERLSKYFKISLVSPELYGRDEVPLYRKLLSGMKIHDVCTDHPEKWK